MKILFVNHTGEMYGGGELGLARYLEQSTTHANELVLMTDGAHAIRARNAGVPTTTLGWNGSKTSPSLLWATARLWRHIAASDCDAVVCNGLVAAQFVAPAPKRGKKFILHLRQDVAWLKGHKRAFFEHYVLPRFDAFLANSNWTASTLPASLAHKPVRTVYPMSGVPGLPAGVPGQRSAQLGRDDAPLPAVLRILSIGRLEPQKGAQILLEAVTLLRLAGLGDRVAVTFAGSAPSEAFLESLKRRAAPLGDMVSFVGQVNDVQRLLRSHHVLACCSLLPEAFGQVVVQGMSAGLAVVATDQGGPRELIENGRTGILVPPDDPAALAQAIRHFILNPSAAFRMGAAAMSESERYSDPHMAQQLTSAIEQLVGHRQEAHAH